MESIAQKSDLELSALMQSDVEAAFEELYNRYWKPLFLSACRTVGEPDAKDMVQEVLLSFWRRRNAISFQRDQEIPSYLFVALKYRVISHYAYSQKEVKKANYLQHPMVWTPEHLLESKEVQHQLETTIQNMPERMQLIFRMSREEQLSIADIALRLNLSEQTVKNQISQALKRLKSALHQHYGHATWSTFFILSSFF